jgi:hypothetical protein
MLRTPAPSLAQSAKEHTGHASCAVNLKLGAQETSQNVRDVAEER